MPFERRDIAERTIFPKHIFSIPSSLVQVLGGAGEARVHAADVAAEDHPSLAGLGILDDVALWNGARVFVHSARAIFAASAEAWARIEEVVGPAIVIVRLGRRFAGSVHAVDTEGEVSAHFAYVGRSGSILYTLTPTDWTLLQLTEDIVPSPDVTNTPNFALSVPAARRGLYAVHVAVYAVPSGGAGGTWTGALQLAVLANGLPVPFEQPNDIAYIATPGSPAALQTSLLWRVQGETYTVGIRATPAGEFELKAYVGLHRLL